MTQPLKTSLKVKLRKRGERREGCSEEIICKKRLAMVRGDACGFCIKWFLLNRNPFI